MFGSFSPDHFHSLPEVFPEQLGRGIRHDPPLFPAARRVVPVRNDRGEHVLPGVFVPVEKISGHPFIGIMERNLPPAVEFYPLPFEKRMPYIEIPDQPQRIHGVDPRRENGPDVRNRGVLVPDEVDSRQAVLFGQLPPRGDENLHLGVRQRFVDHKQRLAVHRNVTMVPKSGQHGPEMRRIVFDASVELFDQHVPVRDPVGEAPPALIGPGQRERKIGFAAGQHLVEGTFQQPLAVAEPVMPVDEALDAVFAGHIRLRLARLGDPQVVIPQIGRNSGLIVISEIPPGLTHVRPFGKTLSPPQVVLRDGVKLRQIQCQ